MHTPQTHKIHQNLLHFVQFIEDMILSSNGIFSVFVISYNGGNFPFRLQHCGQNNDVYLFFHKFQANKRPIYTVKRGAKQTRKIESFERD